ncbi:hypothetical protein [Microcoleus sp. bin48.metabat.b7b8b9.023]|uniref:hypothetical protein n=1 Tax=unclassified Microcoleus TaxID=2642155 RepID=UPI003454D67E
MLSTINYQLSTVNRQLSTVNRQPSTVNRLTTMSKPVILCVDDKTVILESLKAQLRKALGSSYAYEFAQDAEEALNIIDELNIAVIRKMRYVVGLKPS